MTAGLTKKGAATPQSKPKKDKIDKRLAIVKAAQELFTGQGYENTTIAEVAKKAGVAVGTVYLYFKTKPEILEAVQGDWDVELVQYMQELDLQKVPHHLRARPIIEAVFRMCSQHAEMVQLMGLQPQMIGDEDSRKIQQSEVLAKGAFAQDKDFLKGHEGSLLHQAIKDFFDEGVGVGAFRLIDTKAAAIVAFGMVHSSLHQCFDFEGGQSQERYISILVDVLEHWLIRPEVIEE